MNDREAKKRAEALLKEIDDICAKLHHLNELSGNMFEKTLITDKELDFAKHSPYTKMYRDYQLLLADKLSLLEPFIIDRLPFEEQMELVFFLAAYYALLGEIEKMRIYASRIDWARWSPLKSKNTDTVQMYRDLYARGQEIVKRKKSKQ